MNDHLEIWTVTKSPSDLPGVAFAARAHLITAEGPRASDKLVTGETLEAVRAQLPPGVVNLGRHPGDDPVIVESWI